MDMVNRGSFARLLFQEVIVPLAICDSTLICSNSMLFEEEIKEKKVFYVYQYCNIR